MSHPEVHGVVVIERNGDRRGAHQDPVSYQVTPTESTPLGEVQAHQVGSYLRRVYFNPDSSSRIRGISTDIVDLKEVHVRVKVGTEGASVFDTATATLQGLFPPNPKNSITLANDTKIVAPLGGYQYIPVETVEPANDRSLESWTDCPNFQNHVRDTLSGDKLKKAASEAAPFFRDVHDFVFGRAANMENIYNIWDFMENQLTHNKTYAYRLPPTFREQARHWANVRESTIFGSEDMHSIANIASRTLLDSVIGALQRVAFNGDPLQFMLISTTYEPFISLFHQTKAVNDDPDLFAIPNSGAALAIELRRAPPPDVREFLRFKFRNGTDEEFRTIHVFDHGEDIPLTEFIYRLENSVIHGNREWARACGNSIAPSFMGIEGVENSRFLQGSCILALFFSVMMLAWFGSFVTKRIRRRNYIRLSGEEGRVEPVNYGARSEKF
ncbi:phosphoglycerate mutase-like protein [Phanerochaete sordida]|uniref:Phosphoglycerate mutase-like protein n=1 Tax=Phanerochaete sordida TaxID=48140 RepID=A0A9P3LJA5_9APHY|nr:phosphoglycerate mutase-like protein [Phanerochaete sordida]